MALPSTVANPQLLAVTSSSVAAVVAPAACTSVTIHQQQGSDPPSYNFNVYGVNLSTKLNSTVLPGGSEYTFFAPQGTFFSPGQTVGGVELPSTSSGTAAFQVFANVAPGGQLPPSALPITQRAVVTLSSAQLLALQTTAVQILPAPPPGYMINVKNMIANYSYGGTAYTIASSDNDISLEYTGQSTSLIKAVMTGLADQTVNGWTPGVSGLTTVLASSVATGLGVEAKLIGTTPALTLGNGTVTLIVDYALLSIQ